jgi:hypothetical protein
MRIDPLPG